MLLWKLTQSVHTGYDTYDSAIVAAETPEAACFIHPNGNTRDKWWEHDWMYRDWAHPRDVTAILIGKASVGLSGVVCASFNAG